MYGDRFTVRAMNRLRKFAPLGILVSLLVGAGFLAPYLSRPWLDTIIITFLPVSILGMLITTPALLYRTVRKRGPSRVWTASLLISLSCGAPFLGWSVGNQIFEPEVKWKVFVYNKSDNGFSHKQMGSYVSADGCRAAGRKLLSLPTKLNIQDCSGVTCLADHFMCGLDCGIDPEHDASFISGFICKEQFDEDIMLGL
jgi:hypothetical protein